MFKEKFRLSRFFCWTALGLHSNKRTAAMSSNDSISGLPVSQQTTTVVRLGNLPYYARHKVEATLGGDFGNFRADRFIPATVIHLSPSDLTVEIVKSKFSDFLKVDDVFEEGFTHNAHIFVSFFEGLGTANQRVLAKNGNQTSQELAEFLQSRELGLHIVHSLAVPEGPYFIHGHDLHQAWRLVPDRLGAFVCTVIPDDLKLGRHVVWYNSAFTGCDGLVAIPSRLYFTKTSEKPLSGQRIAIKDNMHLNGVVTGLGSKSYARLYGEQTDNSALVQILLDKGAVIVGKTKLSAFAGSEVPPNQCIDYFPPWNARGDGYQGPSGSSSGAGSSAGGYDWLDVSIGTDTGGSTRFPATSHGVWGLKVTWNSIPVSGLVKSCEAYDSIGLFARSTHAVQGVLTAANVSPAPDSLPSKLLFPTEWFPLANEAQQRMTDAFVEALEAHLGIKHTKISLEAEWKISGPKNLRNKTLVDMGNTGQRLYGYDMYHNFDAFRAEYKETFQELPYVSPTHTARWDKWKGTSDDERNESFADVMAVRKWWQDCVFSGHNSHDTIMIVPHGRPGPNYRDQAAAPPAPPAVPKADPIILTTMAGVPQVVIPIGQNPYESRISGRTEYNPIFTTLAGAPGTDSFLLKVAEGTLEQAGWPTDVLTGRFMFDVGNNIRNSAKPAMDVKL